MVRDCFLENKRTHLAQLDFGTGAQAQPLFQRGKTGPKEQSPALADGQRLLRRGQDQVGNQVGPRIPAGKVPGQVFIGARPDIRRPALAPAILEFDVGRQIGGADGRVEHKRYDRLRIQVRMVRPWCRIRQRKGRRFHAPAQNGRRWAPIRARQTGPQREFIAMVQRQRLGRRKRAAARADPGENAIQRRLDEQRRRLRRTADLFRPDHRLVKAQFKGGGRTGRGGIENQFDVFGAVVVETAAHKQEGGAGGKKKFHTTARRSSLTV